MKSVRTSGKGVAAAAEAAKPSAVELAIQALRHRKFSQFFYRLPLVEANHVYNNILLDALKIILDENDMERLHSLCRLAPRVTATELSMREYYEKRRSRIRNDNHELTQGESFYYQVFERFLETNDVLAAIGLATLSHHNFPTVWYILLHLFVKHKKFSHAQSLEKFVTSVKEKKYIALDMLEALHVNVRDGSWFFWLDVYFEVVDEKVPEDLLLQKLIDIKDAERLVEGFARTRDSEHKSALFQSLFLYCLLHQEENELAWICEALFPLLTANQQWLIDLYHQMANLHELSALDSMPAKHCGAVIKAILPGLLVQSIDAVLQTVRTVKGHQEDLVDAIICGLVAVEQADHIILFIDGMSEKELKQHCSNILFTLLNVGEYVGWSLLWCIAERLLPLVSGYAASLAVQKLVEYCEDETTLTKEQWCFLAPYLALGEAEFVFNTDPAASIYDHWPQCVFPRAVVEAEIARRVDEVMGRCEAHMAVGESESKRRYHSLHGDIRKLMKLNAVAHVLPLLMKIEPSIFRDNLIFECLDMLSMNQQMALCKQYAELLFDDEQRSTLLTSLSHMDDEKFADAMNAVNRCRYSRFKSNFIISSIAGIVHTSGFPDCLSEFARVNESSLNHDDRGRVVALVWDDGESQIDILCEALKKFNLQTIAEHHFASRVLVDVLRRVFYMSRYAESLAIVSRLSSRYQHEFFSSCYSDGDEISPLVRFQREPLPKNIFRIIADVASESVSWQMLRMVMSHPEVAESKNQLQYILRIKDDHCRDYYLEQHINQLLCKKKYKYASKAVTHLSSEKQEFWLGLVGRLKSEKYFDVLKNLLKHERYRHVQLVEVVAEWWLENAIISELFAFQELFEQMCSDNQAHYCQAVYVKVLGCMVTLHVRDKRSSALVTLLKRVETGIVKAKHMLAPEFFAQLELAMLSCFRNKHLKQAMILLEMYFDAEPVTNEFGCISEIIKLLISQGGYQKAHEVLERAFEHPHINYYGCSNYQSWVFVFADGCLDKMAYRRLIAVLRKHKSTQSLRYKLDKVFEYIGVMLERGAVRHAIELQQVFDQACYERYQQKMAELLVKHGYHDESEPYISKLSLPSMQFDLRKAISESERQKVEKIISPEFGQSLRYMRETYATLEEIREEDEHKYFAERNKLVVAMRSLLDKAFIKFYKTQYEDEDVFDKKRITVYFPVVPDLSQGTVEDGLRHYFKHRVKQPTFDQNFPKVFEFLCAIQPLSNPKFIWLSQLYEFANRIKHDDANIPYQPIVSGNKLKINAFIPQVIQGIEEILLQLFNPQMLGKSINLVQGKVIDYKME